MFVCLFVAGVDSAIYQILAECTAPNSCDLPHHIFEENEIFTNSHFLDMLLQRQYMQQHLYASWPLQHLIKSNILRLKRIFRTSNILNVYALSINMYYSTFTWQTPYYVLWHYLIISLGFIYQPSQSAWKGGNDKSHWQLTQIWLFFPMNTAVMTLWRIS